MSSFALPSPYLGDANLEPPEPDLTEEQFEEYLIDVARSLYDNKNVEIDDMDLGIYICPTTGDAWVNASVRIPKEDFTT